MLIVSEVSRLGRSVREIANTFHELERRGVMVHAIKENIRANGKGDMSTRALTTLFGLAAEMERDFISQRTKAGLARAKAQGKKLGNPDIHRLNTGQKQKAWEFAEKMRPTLEAYRAQGMSQRKIVEQLNALGIGTMTGRQWSLTQLQRVLKRLGID